MFSGFFSLFSGSSSQNDAPSSPEVVESKDVSSKFSSQEEILDAVGAPESEKGLCAPLANSYTKYQLDKGSRDFMEGEAKDIYRKAVDERDHQVELQRRGQDGVNSAFVDTQTDYSIRFAKPDELKSPEGIQSIVKESGGHAIITYPVKDESDNSSKSSIFHQVAVGKDKDSSDKCYSFSASQKGGERIEPCSSSFFEISKEYRRLADERSSVMVASDKRRP